MKKLKIYLVMHISAYHWDEYDSGVVVAASEADVAWFPTNRADSVITCLGTAARGRHCWHGMRIL
jgi:hypothetical protein